MFEETPMLLSIIGTRRVGPAIINSADDPRKDSATPAFSRLVVRNGYRAKTHHEFNRVNPSDVAHEKRSCKLLRLYLANVLAGAPGGLLSSSAEFSSAFGKFSSRSFLSLALRQRFFFFDENTPICWWVGFGISECSCR